MKVAVEPTPVVKRLRVRLEPAAAFDLFTRELARWWPLATHSCMGDDAMNVVIEPCVGGKVIEHARDGRQAPWGTVLAWDPPHRFAMTWHPMCDPAMATRVDVSFVASADGGSDLELVHAGWGARGEDAGLWRDRYDGGWGPVLDRYATAANK